jgi:hypothetical protein
MKNYYCILIALFLGIVACEKDDKSPGTDPDSIAKEIVLTAPANVVEIDLNEVEDVSFAWNAVSGISGYTLVLSTSMDLSTPQTIAAAANPLAVSAAELDAKAAALGMAAGATNRIFWSIKPDGAVAGMTTQTRVITLTRITPTIALTAPAENEIINANTSTFPCTFSWTVIPEVTAYTLRFSKDATFPAEATKSYNKAGAASHVFATKEEFDAMLTDPAINGSGKIFWTVTPTSPDYVFTEVLTRQRSFNGVVLEATTIRLNAPADNAVIDANEAAFPYTFRWLPMSTVTGYTLKFSTNNAFSGNVAFSTTTGERTLTQKEFDDLLAGLSLDPDATATVYWTVVPTNSNEDAGEPEIRSFTAKRAGPRPLSTAGWIVTSNATTEGDLANLIDGNHLTFWTGSGASSDWVSWIKIDLQEAKRLSEISLHERIGYTYNTKVYASMSDEVGGENPQQNINKTKIAEWTMNAIKEYSKSFTNEITARYIYIYPRIYGADRPSFYEVTLTGYDF